MLAQETQKGRRWDEAKIKNLTGGDRLTARYMRGDLFQFKPTHKLMISGQSQAVASQRRRSYSAPHLVGPVHGAEYRRRNATRSLTERLESRMAGDPSVDGRRLPRMEAGRAQDPGRRP